MVILGLDPGIAITGYGVIRNENNKLENIEFGCIKTMPGQEEAERLKIIKDELALIIKKHNPDIASIEKIFFTTNAKTVISVAQARGVALETLSSAGITIYEYTPLQVKQAVTSYGKADKSQVQKMVKLLLGLEEIPKPDDAADALAIAICCANSNLNYSN